VQVAGLVQTHVDMSAAASPPKNRRKQELHTNEAATSPSKRKSQHPCQAALSDGPRSHDGRRIDPDLDLDPYLDTMSWIQNGQMNKELACLHQFGANLVLPQGKDAAALVTERCMHDRQPKLLLQGPQLLLRAVVTAFIAALHWAL
jgi:hypothetical protein